MPGSYSEPSHIGLSGTVDKRLAILDIKLK